MANIGDILTNPESGYQRISCLNLNVKYTGSWTYDAKNTYSLNVSDYVEFYFYGTKIELCNALHNSHSQNVTINLDGTEENFSQYQSSSTAQYYTLCYKKEGLEKKIHKVKIYSTETSAPRMSTIDIDEDGYMCTSDGRYIDVTPIMTSDTTPVPYVITYSGLYGQDVISYGAFDGATNNKDFIFNISTGWLKFDFGTKTRINTFNLYIKTVNATNMKHFKLYGSNDDSSYDELYDLSLETNTWTVGNHIFKLDGIKEYRYYKIESLENFGASGTRISELRFLLDTETPFYLIQDNADNKTYNYDESTTSLVEVADTSIVKEDVLNNTCIYDLSKVIPLLDTLSDDLTIFCNNDKKVVAKGIKSNLELIVSKQTLSANIAHLIRELEVICTLVGNGNIKVVVNRDKGSTWSYWDTTTNAWLNLANTVTKRDYNSMTDAEKEKWEALKQEAWQYGMTPDIVKLADFESIKDNGFKFAFVLSRPTYEDNAVLKELDWTYDEDGGYIVLNNTDILIKKTDKYIKLVPQRNMTDVKVEIVN